MSASNQTNNSSSGGGALVQSLPPAVLTSSLLSFLWYDDLVRLSWCDKTLHRIVGTLLAANNNSRKEGIRAVGLRRAKHFHETKGLVEMRRLTAAEQIFFTFGCTWEEALSEAAQLCFPNQPIIVMDDDEYLRHYNGKVKLCCGFVVNYRQLWNAIYPGRRWYRNKKIPSQPLSEPPNKDGNGEYTEFDIGTTKEDVSFGVWLGDELAYSDPRSKAATRPPGLKAWKGPSMKSHLETAIVDLAKRLGLEGNFQGLTIHWTGGAESGDEELVGIPIGKKMEASCFDIDCVTGQGLFPNGWTGYDIIPASDEYASATVQWKVDSPPFRAMKQVMLEPMTSLQQNLVAQEGGVVSEADFWFVCNNY